MGVQRPGRYQVQEQRHSPGRDAPTPGRAFDPVCDLALAIEDEAGDAAYEPAVAGHCPQGNVGRASPHGHVGIECAPVVGVLGGERRHQDRRRVAHLVEQRVQIGVLDRPARSGPDLRAALRQPPLTAMPVEYQTPVIEDRAVEVLTLLADRGLHRAPSIPDLIIAATAEMAGLTVLHLDKDFEIIAGITGQPCERLNISYPFPFIAAR